MSQNFANLIHFWSTIEHSDLAFPYLVGRKPVTATQQLWQGLLRVDEGVRSRVLLSSHWADGSPSNNIIASNSNQDNTGVFERQLGDRSPRKHRWRDIKIGLMGKVEYFWWIQMHEACGATTVAECASVKVWILKSMKYFIFLFKNIFKRFWISVLTSSFEGI